MLGLLWFDNNEKMDAAEKIRKAAGYYVNKYGNQPTTCYVHPQIFSTLGTHLVDAIVVKSARWILPNHFLIGNEENISDNFRQGKLLGTE